MLDCFQLRIGRHQPFDPLPLERDLQTTVLAAAFQIDNGALAKLGMAYALPKFVAGIVFRHWRAHSLMAYRAADRGAQTYLFNTRFRQFTNKARREKQKVADNREGYQQKGIALGVDPG